MNRRVLVCAMAVAAVSVAGCTRPPEPSGAGAPTTAVGAAPVTTVVAATTTTVRMPPADTTSTTTSTTSASTTSTSATTSTSSTTTSSTSTTTVYPAPGSSGSLREIRPASDIPPPPMPDDWIVEPIGTSVQGREIESWSRRVANARRTVVVIGAVHGNEPASPPTVRALVEVAYPADVEVWLVPELNPDGVAAGTRWNANGVDLNRNFPWAWQADDGGPAALSEPEARAAVELIERLAPDIVVWVHQPYGYVSSVGLSDDVFEEAWSAGSGLPVRPDVVQHGGGESWTNLQAGYQSMLIEIDTWGATPAMVAAQRAGFEQLLATLT